MSISSHAKTLAAAAAVLLMLGAGAFANSLDPAVNAAQEQAFVQAGAISKQQAIRIALKAVGGGKVVQAVFETQDNVAHWSIDILGKAVEHEVWVAASGKVLRIITQPI